MSSCDDRLHEHRDREPPTFNAILKGAGAFAMIAITVVGASAPLFGFDYSIPAQSAAALVGAVAGVALSLRA